jgi:hypothetical protein
MRRSAACRIVPVLLLGVAAGAAGSETCFTAFLDGVQAGSDSPAEGVARFRLDDAETRLSYRVDIQGLESAEVSAHIHSDAEAGAVLHTLPPGAIKTGTWTNADFPALSPARVNALRDGEFHVDVHTVGDPEGEIQGALLGAPCDEECFRASLDGGQAGTFSEGTGTGLFILDHTRTRLRFEVHYAGVGSPETDSHIHSETEVVVFPLPLGSPKVGDWNSTSVPALTPSRVEDLLDGLLYVNVHTDAHFGGEIRGQILARPCGRTGVLEDPGPALFLARNAPNPFTGATILRFTVVEGGHASLLVHDLAGRLVRVVFEGDVDPGLETRALWDGRDARGTRVPAGAYVYRLSTRSGSRSGKMLHLP